MKHLGKCVFMLAGIAFAFSSHALQPPGSAKKEKVAVQAPVLSYEVAIPVESTAFAFQGYTAHVMSVYEVPEVITISRGLAVAQYAFIDRCRRSVNDKAYFKLARGVRSTYRHLDPGLRGC